MRKLSIMFVWQNFTGRFHNKHHNTLMNDDVIECFYTVVGPFPHCRVSTSVVLVLGPG